MYLKFGTRILHEKIIFSFSIMSFKDTTLYGKLFQISIRYFNYSSDIYDNYFENN